MVSVGVFSFVDPFRDGRSPSRAPDRTHILRHGLLTLVDDDGEQSKGLVFPPLMSNPDGDGQVGFRKNLEASVKFL